MDPLLILIICLVGIFIISTYKTPPKKKKLIINQKVRKASKTQRKKDKRLICPICNKKFASLNINSLCNKCTQNLPIKKPSAIKEIYRCISCKEKVSQVSSRGLCKECEGILKEVDKNKGLIQKMTEERFALKKEKAAIKEKEKAAIKEKEKEREKEKEKEKEKENEKVKSWDDIRAERIEQNQRALARLSGKSYKEKLDKEELDEEELDEEELDEEDEKIVRSAIIQKIQIANKKYEKDKALHDALIAKQNIARYNNKIVIKEENVPQSTVEFNCLECGEFVEIIYKESPKVSFEETNLFNPNYCSACAIKIEKDLLRTDDSNEILTPVVSNDLISREMEGSNYQNSGSKNMQASSNLFPSDKNISRRLKHIRKLRKKMR